MRQASKKLGAPHTFEQATNSLPFQIAAQGFELILYGTAQSLAFLGLSGFGRFGLAAFVRFIPAPAFTAFAGALVVTFVAAATFVSAIASVAAVAIAIAIFCLGIVCCYNRRDGGYDKRRQG